MLLRSTEKFDIFCSFQIFDIFLSTHFAQNMNSALPSNRILSIGEYLVIAKLWGFLNGCSEKKVCALKFRKMHTKSEKISKKIFCHFLLIRMERNAHITANLVY